MEIVQIEDLLGRVPQFITLANEGESLMFKMTDGTSYIMSHDQECCEHVRLVETIGDIQDLLRCPIRQAVEASSQEPLDGTPENPDSFTWTFYRISTIEGTVVLRWLGESNGYYSEKVSIYRYTRDEPVPLPVNTEPVFGVSGFVFNVRESPESANVLPECRRLFLDEREEKK